ncbi:hypothetical protein OWM54_28175 [Myxococcus sp. MISCRS1]|uniref:hypothetical protein n=1 Tax=Myxococcus sp. MISCRS1 TaxID=2996786 RepID=UPI00226D55B3|nr:hypothetical protein [Myxococcus sp. MISCRS1]MCY1001035.1 hypothetical protein [Myxococcus sp. MISCRS1]
MPVDFAAKVLAVLSEHGAVTRIQRIENAPESGYHVYAVFNGPDVLQIGHGKDGRMRSCMRGALAKRHNKAFICALGEKVLGRRNEYAFIEVDSKEQAERIEEHVHAQFGIRTNDDAACLISGLTDVGPVSVERVNRWLWQEVVGLSAYRNLSPGRKVMAEELMDLVTWCTVRERGPGRNRLTAQGDLLEGHTLAKLDKAHLIHIFQELTDDYLRYGSHKLTDEAFRAREQGYQYAPRGARFEIVLEGAVGRRVVMPVAPVRPAAPATPGAPVAARVNGARVLSQKSRLEFRLTELDGLAPDRWIEFRIFNSGTNSDPRRIDVVFCCQVRDVYSFFDVDQDVDWNENGKHSWSRFPQWAMRYVVPGGIVG